MGIGTVRPIDINEEMRDSYLDYAMSVIVARALPDARDGLKPVHRRILYAMHDMGLHSNTPYKKSARIVGEVLGKYHPHGDGAVYDAMARMAQPFSMRYTLVDGQGNFGSIDGDSPAAMRYTEARLSVIADLMLQDIDKNTVDFVDNFDASLQEPDILPAALPNLLLNGVAGIAVGMSTNIPPHNLREIANAVDFLIDRMVAPADGTIDEELNDVTPEELMQFVHGPDFPTGGLIVGSEGIMSAYATGRGRIVMRAAMHVDTTEDGRHRIIITEIPYQVNKAATIERIASLARSGRLDMITDLRDESDRSGMSIVVELRRGAQPRTVMNRLLKYTQLQSTFGVQMLALVNGEPRLLSIKAALRHFINHRREVISRRAQFDLERAQRRAHVIEGLLIAIANLDAAIRTIRESSDADEARTQLMVRFGLTDTQAQAILDMQLRRLAALERQKLEEEYQSLLDQIAGLEDLLAHPRKILESIRADLNELAARHGDERRTRILHDASGSLNEADLIPDEDVFVFITREGYIKRVKLDEYRIQNRGGKGMIGTAIRESDDVRHMFLAGTKDSVLFFTDRGRVYHEKVYQIPASSRSGKGILLDGILQVQPDETVTAIVVVPDFDEAEYLTMLTLHGRIKRVALSEFASVRPSGLIAMTLDEEDELRWVKLTKGHQDLLLVTANGQSLRFSEEQVRPMGRPAAGVNAIRLQEGDLVAGFDVAASPDLEVLVVSQYGYGKRTPLAEYPRRSRFGMGIRTLARNDKTGPVISIHVVQPGDQIMVITSTGRSSRMHIENISLIGRNTQGVRLMKIPAKTTLVSVVPVDEARLTERADALQAEMQDLSAPVSFDEQPSHLDDRDESDAFNSDVAAYDYDAMADTLSDDDDEEDAS